MSLTKLNLENFKRFAVLDLDVSRPITVILGANSSGKSSILKSLLGLKQTISASNEHECWAAQGEYVDLGTYNDFVYRRDARLPFVLKISLQKELTRGLPMLRHVPMLDGIDLTLKYDLDTNTSQARLLHLKAEFGADASSGKLFQWEINRQKTRKNYHLEMSQDLHNHIISRTYPSDKSFVNERISVQNSEKLQFKAINTRSARESFAVIFVNQTIGALTSYIEKSLFYLGPLRSSPSRSYIRSSHSLAVGVKGEYTPSVLANLEKRSKKVTRGESRNITNITAFERWLDMLFPGHHAKTKTIEELVKLKISNDETLSYKGTEKSDTITDVGFGFSQVFPILVQASVMQTGATLIIEQPELHLHPLAQTKLAAVITEAASTGKKFIIETHSEHFIRGLQLAISEYRLDNKKGISKDNVNIFYIKPAPDSYETLDMNEFGEFVTQWPSGFFDESYLTMQKLLMNKLQGA